MNYYHYTIIDNYLYHVFCYLFCTLSLFVDFFLYMIKFFRTKKDVAYKMCLIDCIVYDVVTKLS